MSDFISGDLWERADGGKVRIALNLGHYLLVDLLDFTEHNELPATSRVPYTPDGKCLISWDGITNDFTLVRKLDATQESV